ncbi:hypothetical protein VTJ04DRAFT_9143 [Mycothermus thermophilus]|uniref:uncharacterized protein n=1 Tax=Humicola insolens TaxID=85995 RepID=UPI003742C60A
MMLIKHGVGGMALVHACVHAMKSIEEYTYGERRNEQPKHAIYEYEGVGCVVWGISLTLQRAPHRWSCVRCYLGATRRGREMGGLYVQRGGAGILRSWGNPVVLGSVIWLLGGG